MKLRKLIIGAALAATALFTTTTGATGAMAASGPAPAPHGPTQMTVAHHPARFNAAFNAAAKLGGLKKLITYYYWPESSVNGGNAGYVVDDPNNDGAGTQLQVWTPNGKPQQGWYLFIVYLNGVGYAEIVNENGLCVDDEYDHTANGTKVQVYTCLGNVNQLWNYFKFSGSNGNGALWINYNGACLDDQHPYTDGGKTQMWQCDFPPNNDNAEAWQVPAATW